MLNFAGEHLLLLDSDGKLATFLQDYLDFENLQLFGMPPALHGDRHNSIGGQIDLLRLPVPNYPDPPRLRLNTLYWPSGATRWAYGVFLADTKRKDKIVAESIDVVRGTTQAIGRQLQIAPSGWNGSFDDNEFTTDSNDRVGLSTEMFLLPPLPVADVPDDPDVKTPWLIPLVDIRYFWQFRHTGSNFKWDQDSEWSDLFADLKTQLSLDKLTFTDDPVWGRPDKTEFDRYYENAAMIVDAAAHSVGRRIIRGIDGEVKILHHESSIVILDNNLTDSESTPWNLVAGGDFSEEGTASVVPEFVDVIFRAIDSNLTEGNLISDLIDEEGETRDPVKPVKVKDKEAEWTMQNGVLAIRIQGKEFFDVEEYFEEISKVIRTPSIHNRIFLDDDGDTVLLAKAIAEAYYEHLKHRFNYTFIGIKKWLPTGYDDHMEFFHDKRGLVTRVQSFPYNFGPSVCLAQVGTQCYWNDDFIQGTLKEAMPAAFSVPSSVDGKEFDGSVEVDATVWVEGTGTLNIDKLKVYDRVEKVVNRSSNLSTTAFKHYKAKRVGCKYEVYWVDC